MKKKFAFLLMGKEFDTAKDTAVFETEHMISYIFTVTSFEEALKRAVACAEDGVGAIEVCGAFGKEWATTRSRMSYSGSSSPRHDRSA